MTDYSKLAEALRTTERICRDRMDGQVMLDAADAIEDLEKERDYYKQQYENRQRLIKSALGEEWT